MSPAPLTQVGPGHSAVLAALHAAAFPPDETWSAQAFAAQLELPAVFGLLSGEAGLILARVAADQAEILTLAVAPAWRRRGTGRRLLHAAMRIAGERGAKTMFLEVSPRNGAALALYAATGFAVVGRRARYYANGADCLVLAAPISVSAAEPA